MEDRTLAQELEQDAKTRGDMRPGAKREGSIPGDAVEGGSPGGGQQDSAARISQEEAEARMRDLEAPLGPEGGSERDRDATRRP